jgi:hypothetical protein
MMLGLAALSLVTMPLIALAQNATPTAATPAQGSSAQPPAAGTSKPMAMPTGKHDAMKDEVQRQLKVMADSLKMTPEQREKAKPILMDHANQLKDMRAKYTSMEKTPANKEAMKKDMLALRDATDAKLAQVLNADQMTQYKAMRDAQWAKTKAKMAGREAGEDNK